MAKRSVKLSPELKEVVRALPEKEKTRLLLRLLPKDATLVEQLIFQLLENGETQEERRSALQEKIIEQLHDLSQRRFYSPAYLLFTLRAISGKITRHVRTTKDKYGEIALNLLMLNNAFELMGEKVSKSRSKKVRTLANYALKRAAKLDGLLDKLHEDYQLDFWDDINQFREHINQLIFLKSAYLELDVELGRFTPD